MTQILDGKACAETIFTKVKNQVAGRQVIPNLAVIRVGDDPASAIYVEAKHRACHEVGIRTEDHALDADTSFEVLQKLISSLNRNPNVHGILLQLPLPKHLDAHRCVNLIDPKKDVDGLTAQNAGFLASGKPHMIPCTPRGCVTLLDYYGIPFRDKHVAIIGRSILVGRPLAQLMLIHNCTVTTIHSHTEHPQELCKKADIIVAAAGVPHLVNEQWCKRGATVLDVGISRRANKIIGDVNDESVKGKVQYLTPVPGGIGPMTVASLLENTLLCADHVV